MDPAEKRGNIIVLSSLAECLGVCENYAEEEERLREELKKEDVKQGLLYLRNTDISITGLGILYQDKVYAHETVRVWGMDNYPCRSGKTKPRYSTRADGKLCNLAEIAKTKGVSLGRIVTRSSYSGDYRFFAARAECCDVDVGRAVKAVLAAQRKANEFARPVRFGRWRKNGSE